jgi:hypothetical protein
MMVGVGHRRTSALLRALVAFAFLFPTISNAAPRAAEFGPEVTVGEPKGYVGRLTLSPTHGPVGTPVSVSGENFPPEQEVQLVWTTVKGSWRVTVAEYLGRQFTPVAYQIAKLKTGKDGRIAYKFEAPEDFGFMHDVVVQQGSQLLTQAAFSIDMTTKLLRDSGPLGTEIPVEIQGIGWRELEGSWVLVYDNKYTGFASAITTSGTARFTVPATGHVGLHVLEIIHTDFGSPYRNMQQSPAPDRAQFKVNFAITPGDPVLPPAPEQQAQQQVKRLPPQGDLVASPTFGAIHTPVTVKGTGFEPGKMVALNWTTVTGNRISGGGWEEHSKPIAEAKADASGNVEFKFTAPDDLGGSHGVWADAAGGARKKGTFWIMPTALPLDVARGPAGTTFKIHLKGTGWSETANIYTLTYDNATSGYACGFNSQGDIEIFMQATGEPGWHYIDLWPAIYKGRETRPNNYRLPQLTYADDHPGEDLPRFRFAFEVTKDGTVGMLTPR